MTPPFLAVLNTPEIIALLVLALILFGAKKLPELARGLGQGIKEFKKATRDVTEELHNAVEAEPPSPPRPSPAPYSEPTYAEPVAERTDEAGGASAPPSPTEAAPTAKTD